MARYYGSLPELRVQWSYAEPAMRWVCSSCLEITQGNSPDVIEIDGASNRGISEMRELRENVRYRPARDRYKVFIVDEAHQITSEAFNALLKTLGKSRARMGGVPAVYHRIAQDPDHHRVALLQQFSFRSVDFTELVARMEWIIQQEGIEAGPDVLSVLACRQGREASSRLPIGAGSGHRLLRHPSGSCRSAHAVGHVLALESLDRVALGILEQDSHKMLDVVAELEANGSQPAAFCPGISSGYFRNLLVIRIEKGPTPLVGASAAEQEKMAALAAKFREDDLTRDLKLTLDLFKDLQGSLQPRLHLEMGLLRLVQAARLLPIEEALASLGGGPAPAPKAPRPWLLLYRGPPATQSPVRSAAPVAAVPGSMAPPPAPPETPAPAAASSGDLRTRLLDTLAEAKQTHLADAVEHCNVQESTNEVVFTTPKMYQMYLKSPELEATLKRLLGRTLRITIKVGEVAAPECRAKRLRQGLPLQ